MRPFGTSTLTLSQAWQTYDTIHNDSCVSYLDEPASVEQLWRAYTARQSYSPKVWTDSYLAAFAQAAHLELVTFDRAFSQYHQTKCKILP